MNFMMQAGTWPASQEHVTNPRVTLVRACVETSKLDPLHFQAFLLSMIGEEFNMWFAFAGRMHLCDFGRSMQDSAHMLTMVLI